MFAALFVTLTSRYESLIDFNENHFEKQENFSRLRSQFVGFYFAKPFCPFRTCPFRTCPFRTCRLVHAKGEQCIEHAQCCFVSNPSASSCSEEYLLKLAKPESGAPWLFILTACRASENKRFRIVRFLMFQVAA